MINDYLRRLADRAPAPRMEGSIQNVALHFANAPGMRYGASATTRRSVNIPEGTVGISVITTTGFTSLTLTGHSSGAPYGSASNATAGNFYTFPFSTSPDDQADFAIVTSAGQGGALYARADFSPPEAAQGANFTTKGILRVVPFLAPPVLLGTNNQGNYTFGLPGNPGGWTVLAAAGSLPSDPAGLSQVFWLAQTANVFYFVQLGTGPTNSEVLIGTWVFSTPAASGTGSLGVFPLSLISGNPQLNARITAGQATVNASLAIGVYSLPL